MGPEIHAPIGRGISPTNWSQLFFTLGSLYRSISVAPDVCIFLLVPLQAGLAASVASQGLSYARAHAESTLTKEGAEDNQQGGIPHVNFMQKLVGPGADLSKLKKGGDVPAALEAIALFLFGSRASGAPSRLLRCRVAGEGQQFEQVRWVSVGGGRVRANSY